MNLIKPIYIYIEIYIHIYKTDTIKNSNLENYLIYTKIQGK